MLNSEMYKRYYPVKSALNIIWMDEDDQKQLVKWIRSILSEINAYNSGSGRRAVKNRIDKCRVILSNYNDEDVENLCNKITTDPNSLDSKDIGFINSVLYRHKYIGIISAYYFPTEPVTE